MVSTADTVVMQDDTEEGGKRMKGAGIEGQFREALVRGGLLLWDKETGEVYSLVPRGRLTEQELERLRKASLGPRLNKEDLEWLQGKLKG